MDQVEEVKKKIDIVSLVSEYIELKKAGRNYKALCPFHSEKTPSFMVSPELQIFKCFGCAETGDSISFLQKYEGMDFYEALKFLADRAGVELAPFRPDKKSERERLFQINSLAGKFYHYILLKHKAGKEALKYLTSERGLKLETIKKFQLGYSPEAAEVLKKFLIDKKGYKDNDLTKAGLSFIKNGKVFDRFRGRVIFPLFDHRGNVAGFAGRLLPKDEKKDLAKYINTPETPVYHKGNLLFGLNLVRRDIKDKGEGVIVEGELDMVSSWQAGIKNVVALKGSALTEDQIRLLSRFADGLIFALDADLAGDTAARKGVTLAQKQGLDVKVAKLSGFKDPDEMARKNPDRFKKALKSAIGVWDFMVDSIFSRHDFETGQGKAKVSREIAPILSSIPDKIVQAHYVNIVARKLGVPIEAVAGEVSNLSQEKDKEEVVLPTKVARKSRRQLLEERLMTLSFQSDPKSLLAPDVFNLIETPLSKRILEEYKKFAKEYKEFNPSDFAERLPKELVDGFAEVILQDTDNLVDTPDKLEKELFLVKRELQIVAIREKLNNLGEKIRSFEEKGDKKLRKAEGEFQKLAARLANLEEEKDRGIILHEE